MLVIASPPAKTTKLCLKKLKIQLRFSVTKVKKTHLFLFLKLVFILVGSGMIIPDPDPRKTFRIRNPSVYGHAGKRGGGQSSFFLRPPL